MYKDKILEYLMKSDRDNLTPTKQIIMNIFIIDINEIILLYYSYSENFTNIGLLIHILFWKYCHA